MNMVQSRATTQKCSWRLRKQCCVPVGSKCINWDLNRCLGWMFQQMGSWEVFLIKKISFCFVWHWFVCSCFWLKEKSVQNSRLFFHSVVTTGFFDKAISAIAGKQHNWRFLVFKRIQNVESGFAFQIIGTTFIFLHRCLNIGASLLRTSPARTKDISNITLNWISCSSNDLNPLIKLSEKRIYLFLRENIAHQRRWRALKILTFAFAGRSNGYFACKL